MAHEGESDAGMRAGSDEAVPAQPEVSRARGGWTPAARAFEQALRRGNQLLDVYVEAPRQDLLDTFLGAGSAGRRALLDLVEEQIGLLTTLKQILERGLRKGTAHEPRNAARTAGRASR